MEGGNMSDDTPNLEAAFDKANAELTSQESEETKSEPESEDKPSGEQPKAEEPKEEPKKESDEEVKESFTEKGDLTGKTPEQLEEIYKDWERAYTAKRYAERKELEEMRKKVEELQATKQKPQTPEKPLSEMTPQEYADHVAKLAKEEVEVSRVNSYIDAQEKAFYELDNRLNQDSPEFDSDLHDLVVMRLASARESFEADGGETTNFDFVGNAKRFIEAFDKNIKNKQQQFLEKQAKVARTRSDDFAKKNPKTSGAKTKKKNMDLNEAIEAAYGE